MNLKPKTIGIAGTAKNTGKTTTTIALINHFYGRGVILGLTSIGYDGEFVDNVTGLPKPRLFVPTGMLIVTADKCLEAGTAKIKVLEHLDINTPLGRLACGVVEREGLVVTAGPNQTRHLKDVRDWLIAHGAQLSIIDGALNRIAPMVATDGLILATGAAYKADSAAIAQGVHYLAAMCRYKEPNPGLVPGEALTGNHSTAWDKDGNIIWQGSPSLFTENQLAGLVETAAKLKGFLCPGLITTACLRALKEMPLAGGSVFVFADPVKPIVGCDWVLTHEFLTKLEEIHAKVAYLNPLPLLAVTVNPFYPQFRYEANVYEPAFIDDEKLQQRVQEMAEVPVFDIVKQNCAGLAELIWQE